MREGIQDVERRARAITQYIEIFYDAIKTMWKSDKGKNKGTEQAGKS